MSPDGTRFTHTDPHSDRRPLPRHHRTGAARRDVHRGVHRHARPVGARDRTGAQRRRAGWSAWSSAGITQQTLAQRWREQWPTIAAVGAWARLRFRSSACGRSGAGCCARRTGCVPTSYGSCTSTTTRSCIRCPRVSSCSTAIGWSSSTTRPAGCWRCRPGRVDARRSAGVPAQLRPRRARRGPRHRRPGAGGQPVAGGGLGPLGGGDHPRPHRIAGRARRIELAAGADRLAARAGARGGQQAAHRHHDGGDGPPEEAVSVRDRGAGPVPAAGRPAVRGRRRARAGGAAARQDAPRPTNAVSR